MGWHRFFLPAVLVAAAFLVPTTAAAQRRVHGVRPSQGTAVTRSAVVAQPVATQNVVVRPVQVREVIVGPPVVTPPRVLPRPFGGAQTGVREFRRHGTRRSFHAFKPRVHAGFGVLVGYPVAYPYAYPYAYPSVDPYDSAAYSTHRPAAPARTTYSNVESVTPGLATGQSVECGSADACGGLNFDIAPSNAQISVDGIFVGTVGQFSSSSAPLLLAPGNHFIELRMPGYRTASFDVTLGAGEVTPYQGALEALRTR